MAWLSRLFGRSPAPAEILPEPLRVVIPDDLAAELRREDETVDLQGVVETALRGYLEAKAAPAAPEPGMPFWLRRDEDASDIEDELRDRVTQRRANEAQV